MLRIRARKETDGGEAGTSTVRSSGITLNDAAGFPDRARTQEHAVCGHDFGL
jgi:hypothetical protein